MVTSPACQCAKCKTAYYCYGGAYETMTYITGPAGQAGPFCEACMQRGVSYTWAETDLTAIDCKGDVDGLRSLEV